MLVTRGPALSHGEEPPRCKNVGKSEGLFAGWGGVDGGGTFTTQWHQGDGAATGWSRDVMMDDVKYLILTAPGLVDLFSVLCDTGAALTRRTDSPHWFAKLTQSYETSYYTIVMTPYDKSQYFLWFSFIDMSLNWTVDDVFVMKLPTEDMLLHC